MVETSGVQVLMNYQKLVLIGWDFGIVRDYTLMR
jgi:hypothetical protein